MHIYFSVFKCSLSLQKVSAETSSKMSEEESKPSDFSLETLKSCFEACLGKDNVLYIDKYILGKYSLTYCKDDIERQVFVNIDFDHVTIYLIPMSLNSYRLR